MYDNVLYAKTTVRQEFRDSRLVVRGRVLSNRYRDDDAKDIAGIVSRFRVDEVFKGRAHGVITIYTERSSGAYYLDDAKEYLLFLQPLQSSSWAKNYPNPDAKVVNYSCGQSRPWGQVGWRSRVLLTKLSGR
ncbi:MAG: hypothetical protein JSR45_02120 [Proteobacteria bacterium]|nr:hypothetical protein [Pseudomonadota bacterium]